MATPSIVPLHIFRFRVDVAADKVAPTPPGSPPPGAPVEMCFAECTGLEATMEPKTIKEGGRNYGTAQRTGGVTFATVVLKRGVSTDRGLWHYFQRGDFRHVCTTAASDHHADGRRHERPYGLAAYPCAAGEIQIRRSERERHGGRH